MKRYIAIALISACILALTACQGTISGSDVYSFPETMTQITGVRYSQGSEALFEVGTESAAEWFYGLKLAACDKPEDAEGAECCCFFMNEEEIFGYEDRGSDAYIIVDGSYYMVSNPSAPPINYLYDR